MLMTSSSTSVSAWISSFVGFSDHSGTVYPALAAIALGIDVLEVHVTLSREMSGPDVQSSVTTAELHQMVKGIRRIEEIMANPVDKDVSAQETAHLRDLFTKSVVACVDLPAGTILSEEHLTVKKPGTGIPAERLPEVIGKKLTRNIRADEVLQETDIQ